MQFELMASMMCADYRNLEKEVRELDEAGIDSFHIDIMDGRYVPNYAMSLNDLKCIRSLTDKRLDVHLMVEHPINTIDLFINSLRRGDTIYIHPEAEYHPSTTLQKMIYAGIEPGIAINPGTSVEYVYEILGIVNKVLVMSVNPGNAGQMFLPYVGKKYDKLLKYKKYMNFDVYWDGACNAERIKTFAPMGVKGFVLGTTLLFGKEKPYKDILRAIRSLDI
ncbi:MAG: ribulose-phosphate 3-epimerase [Lachnospiraceae bacterium]|nr:ribulose-phosphate 3-epimerase [Lachnospiraceae bacterium]